MTLLGNLLFAFLYFACLFLITLVERERISTPEFVRNFSEMHGIPKQKIYPSVRKTSGNSEFRKNSEMAIHFLRN